MLTTTTTTDTGPKLRSSVWSTKNGRYVLGGVTEVSSHAIEWWEKKLVLKDPGDLLYTLEEQYVTRLWLLADALYNDPELEWVILQYNDILDPELELVAGLQLILPTIEKINTHYRKDIVVGGTLSTRKL